MVAASPMASVCPVIGTNGSGMVICAKMPIMAANSDAIIIPLSFCRSGVILFPPIVNQI